MYRNFDFHPFECPIHSVVILSPFVCGCVAVKLRRVVSAFACCRLRVADLNLTFFSLFIDLLRHDLFYSFQLTSHHYNLIKTSLIYFCRKGQTSVAP